MRETTNETVRIAFISGSLRRASFSTALLKILAEKRRQRSRFRSLLLRTFLCTKKTSIGSQRFQQWQRSRGSSLRAMVC